MEEKWQLILLLWQIWRKSSDIEYFNISIHLKSKTNKIHYMNNTLVSGDVPVNYMDLIDDKKGRNNEV